MANLILDESGANDRNIGEEFLLVWLKREEKSNLGPVCPDTLIWNYGRKDTIFVAKKFKCKIQEKVSETTL